MSLPWKQKAKEKRSRQSDMTSHLENMEVLLEAYSRNKLGSSQDDKKNTCGS